MAITRVQVTANYTGGTYSLAWGTAPTTGNLLIAVQQGYGLSDSFPYNSCTCTDTNGNIWIKAGVNAGAAFGSILHVWYCWNAIGGAATVSMGYAGAADGGMVLFEYSGVDNTADPLIDFVAPFGSANPLTQSILTEASGLLIAQWGSEISDDFGSFTADTTLISSHADGDWWAWSDNTSTSAGSLNPGVNITPGADDQMMVGISFRGIGGGGGGATVNAGYGELIATGYAPSIDISNHIAIDAATGQLVITGYAPSIDISNHIVIDANTGQLVVTGYAPSIDITNNISIDADTGLLVITGYAPTIDVTNNISIDADTGLLIVTGYAPSIDITGNVYIDADYGELIVTGFAPSIETGAGVQVDAATGQLVVTGYAPVIETPAFSVFQIKMWNGVAWIDLTL